MITKSEVNENRIIFNLPLSLYDWASLILDLKDEDKVCLYIFPLDQTSFGEWLVGKEALEKWEDLVKEQPNKNESIGLAKELLGEL